MLLRLFKGNNPGVIILIAVIFIAVWINPFLHPSVASSLKFSTDPMPLYGILSSLAGKNYFTGLVSSAVMVIAVSFLLVNFNTTSFFINERTYLPALIYILSGGFFPECQVLNPALPASIFFMLAVVRIIDGYRKAGVPGNFFDAAILISTGSLFYANLIWFGVLVIIGIAFIRTVDISAIAIALLGLLTPYFLTFGIYYAAGKDIRALLTLIGNNLFLRTEGFQFSKVTIAMLIISSIMVVMSLFYLVSMLNTKKIKSRKTFSVLIWAFLICIAVYFILPSASVEIVWIAAIPVSYFLTHYFVFIKKKLMPEILFAALFLCVLILQIAFYR
jgi:hypothetical protein